MIAHHDTVWHSVRTPVAAGVRALFVRAASAALALALTTAGARASAQGVPKRYAPEQGVRMPTPDPVAGRGEDEDVEAEVELDMERARKYRDGQLVPPGHKVVTTYHGPLLGTGVALFGFHWVLSLVLAGTDFRLNDSEIERDESRNNPLMAPLIGPFIALGTESTRPGGEMALLALDGVAQVGSLAMAMGGLLLEQKWLVPWAAADFSMGPGSVTVRFD